MRRALGAFSSIRWRDLKFAAELFREVLECGCLLQLLHRRPADAKRQRAGAVQDAGALYVNTGIGYVYGWNFRYECSDARVGNNRERDLCKMKEWT